MQFQVDDIKIGEKHENQQKYEHFNNSINNRIDSICRMYRKTRYNEDSSYLVMIQKDKSGNVINKVDMSQPK